MTEVATRLISQTFIQESRHQHHYDYWDCHGTTERPMYIVIIRTSG